MNKIPIQPNGRNASSTDSSTWCDFGSAHSAYEEDDRISGVGFVLSREDRYAGLDFDHCRDVDTGEINDDVKQALLDFNTYTEISPSGTGIRAIYEGQAPKGKAKNERLEIYDHARFLTMTGEAMLSYSQVPQPIPEPKLVHWRNFFIPQREPASVQSEDPILNALAARGMVQREIEPGVHAIDCPWWQEHTGGDKSGTKYLQANFNGHDRAVFHCHHAHCDGKHIGHLIEFLQIEERKGSPLVVFRASQWQDKPVPVRRWAWQDWIPEGVVTGLGGAGGASKSTLMQQLCTHKSLGVAYLGMPLDPSPALYLTCEDDADELQRRQSRINEGLGIQHKDNQDLYIISRVGEDAMLVEHKGGRFRRTKRFIELDEILGDLGIKLIGLDLLPDFWNGNENDRQQVNEFVKQHLAYFAKRHKAGLVGIYHPSLSGITSGSGTSGSTAWEGSFRSRLYMEANKDDDSTRVLSRKKANYASLVDEVLVWKEGYLMEHSKAGKSAKQRRDEEVDSAFMTCMYDAASSGVVLKAAQNAQGYFARIFETMWVADGRHKPIHAGAFRQACDRAIARGLVEIKSRKKEGSVVVLKVNESL